MGKYYVRQKVMLLLEYLGLTFLFNAAQTIVIAHSKKLKI